MNLEIFEFKEMLIRDINESSLPMVVKQMAVQDILNQINVAAANAIVQERAAREAKEEESVKGEGEKDG